MSYRSLKSVLGETSLERKCRFLFGACLFALIVGSFTFYGRQTERLIGKQNQVTGRLLVDSFVRDRHWLVYQSEYTVDGHDMTPSVRDLREDLRSQNYQATFLHNTVPKDAEFKSRPVNDFEWDVFANAFPIHRPGGVTGAETEQPEFRERYSADGSQYFYYQPVRAKSVEGTDPQTGKARTFDACAQCHEGSTTPYWAELRDEALPAETGDHIAKPLEIHEGDILGIAKLQFSTTATRRELSWNQATLYSTAVVTVFLAMIASWAIVKYVIVKPLKHLRNVSDAISRGNMEMRAEIHTADEFEELGVAFNRMLRHLMAVQQELREVNADLDAKVDQLAQANMRLFEANRLKGDFLATMSHELRTPLNGIIGFSDVLASIRTLDDKQRRYVQNIQNSGKVLLEMVNEVLDLAKIESGKMDVHATAFLIEHVVNAQCDMARPLTERKNIDLDVELEPGLPELHQDQAKIQQIFNNLLSNAIKFTPEGGRIVVSARRDDAFLALVVADTGVGIAPADQATIFEKFRQGSSVTPSGDAMTREYTGTGLGLSIVKELCRLLGGEVSLDSELGKGSTFTVRLPWNLADAANLQGTLMEAADELTHPQRPELERALAKAATVVSAE